MQKVEEIYERQLKKWAQEEKDKRDMDHKRGLDTYFEAPVRNRLVGQVRRGRLASADQFHIHTKDVDSNNTLLTIHQL